MHLDYLQDVSTHTACGCPSHMWHTQPAPKSMPNAIYTLVPCLHGIVHRCVCPHLLAYLAHYPRIFVKLAVICIVTVSVWMIILYTFPLGHLHLGGERRASGNDTEDLWSTTLWSSTRSYGMCVIVRACTKWHALYMLEYTCGRKKLKCDVIKTKAYGLSYSKVITD